MQRQGAAATQPDSRRRADEILENTREVTLLCEFRGERHLGLDPRAIPTRIDVVLNWFLELNVKVPPW